MKGIRSSRDQQRILHPFTRKKTQVIDSNQCHTPTRSASEHSSISNEDDSHASDDISENQSDIDHQYLERLQSKEAKISNRRKTIDQFSIESLPFKNTTQWISTKSLARQRSLVPNNGRYQSLGKKMRLKNALKYSDQSKNLHQETNDQIDNRAAAYCICAEISLLELYKSLTINATKGPEEKRGSKISQDTFPKGWKFSRFMGGIHATFHKSNEISVEKLSEEKQEIDEGERPKGLGIKTKDAYYFGTGCCVFWGMQPEEEKFHMKKLVPYCIQLLPRAQTEDMLFHSGDRCAIAHDIITLSSSSHEEKLALSFALAQSTKLDVFEERVDARITSSKPIPFNLATTGSLSAKYAQKDISKLIGQLFIELADVNLHSDMLDEPDFFWDNDEFEPHYRRMLKYLHISKRVTLLNKRLDLLRELVEVLNQELTHSHGTKLEWIIIWLLVAEILISVGWDIIVKDLLGYFH